jgi:hypothetical protein
VLLALAAPVRAQTPTRTVTATVTASTSPVLVSDLNRAPAGYRLTGRQVLRIASAEPEVRAQLRRHPRWAPYEYTKGPGLWQVSWFSATRPQKERMQVYVDDAGGRVTQAWTGFQVAWTMARGYPGAFGRQVNAWYLWVPLCLLFIAPFVWPCNRVGRRRPPQGDGGPAPGRRPSLLLVDLLVLLGFSASLAFFNHGMIGLSVPLVYPLLIYLLARMLLLANGRGLPRAPLHGWGSARSS